MASLLIRVAAIPVSLAVNALLARSMEIAEFGIFGIATSVMTILAMPVARALSSISLREISRSAERNAKDEVVGELAMTVFAIIAASLLYWLLVTLAGYASISAVFDSTVAALRHTFILFPAFIVTLVAGAVIRSFERISLGALPEHLLRQLVFLVGIALASSFGAQLVRDASWAFDIQSLALVAAAVCSLCLLVWVLPTDILSEGAVFRWGRWSHSFGPFLLLGFTQIANSQLPMLSLGLFGQAEGAAFYRVSDQLAGLAALGLLAVNLAFAPTISRANARGDKDGLQTVLLQSMRLIYLLTVPAILFLVVFSTTILGLLFGPEFREAWPILLVLCLRTGFNAIAGPVGLMLNMLGHERETLRGVRLSLLCNVVLAIVLVPMLGALGAALSSTCATVVFNVLLIRRLHELEGYSTSPLFYKPRYGQT